MKTIVTIVGARPQFIKVASVSRAIRALHCVENTDDPAVLANLVAALERVAAHVPVVLPLHPRTRNAMARLGLSFDKVKIIEPVGDRAMVALESQAIATDFGGVQKEAFFSQVPCITLRAETQWSELLDLGGNRLVDPASPAIAVEILASIGSTGQAAQPYGDGTASQSIAAALLA